MEEQKHLIIVRGGGDLATGTIHKLNRCGYPVLVLETGFPSAIRRHVAFSEAVYDGVTEVEGTVCVKASGVQAVSYTHLIREKEENDGRGTDCIL